MYTTRGYSENYYTSRKKILDDFVKDEESETMKYIEDIEQLVGSTKIVLKGLVSGELDFDKLKDKLLEIESDLNDDCIQLEQDINNLNSNDKNIEESTIELQKSEDKGTSDYLQKIDDLKKELELKEFKIQNMERLYVELENIIKENIRVGNEQLLSLEQFAEFVEQNNKLKEECEGLESEKKKLVEDYNNLLRENLNLRSKDESFELEKIKDALEEISTIGNLQKEAENRINQLQTRFKNLNNECTELTNQIKTITKNLVSLNIDNSKLEKELALINKELNPNKIRLNKSFTESINENDKTFPYLSNNYNNEEVLNSMKMKKNKHTKTTFM